MDSVRFLLIFALTSRSVPAVREDLECIVNSDFCSCDFSDGRGKINLAPLASTSKDKPAFDFITAANTRYRYAFNPCFPFNDGKSCTVEKNTVACQRGKDGNSMSASIGAKTNVSFIVTGETDVQMIIESGDLDRRTVITLQCDENLNATAASSNMTFVKEDPTYTYMFNLKSKCACVNGCKSSKYLSISIGTVLLIILVSIITIYLVAGILFMKFRRGATGLEIIPNHGFWFSLPGYIKDGIKFMFGKCRKTNVEYEEL